MRIPRLYVPLPLTQGEHVVLPEDAYNHGIRVLRLKLGMPLILFNGQGGEYRAVLERLERRQAVVRIAEFSGRESESPLTILLAQGISKGIAMDYTLQKAVELGVNAIQPLWVERSVVNLRGDRLTRRLAHWRGIIIGACEQSGRNHIPQLRDPLSLNDYLEDLPEAAVNVVLDPEVAHVGLKKLQPPSTSVTLLIGPEGGLSPTEITSALAAGFIGVRLGPRVLRAETAGVAALAALQVLWGDFA